VAEKRKGDPGKEKDRSVHKRGGQLSRGRERGSWNHRKKVEKVKKGKEKGT